MRHLLIALLLAPQAGFAAETASFLNIGGGAHGLGMGGAYTTLADDASALYWNPAGLSKLEKREFTTSHAALFESTRLDFLAYAHPTAQRTFAATATYLTQSALNGRGATDRPTGGYSDTALLGAALALLALGTAMLYSASAIYAEKSLGRPLYFLQRQLIWAVVSLAAMGAASRLDYNRLREWLLPIFAAACATLLAALFFEPVAGARRWIRLGPVGLQPAEFAKLAAILFLAAYLDRKHSKLGSFAQGIAVPLGVVSVLLILIGLEPDLGTPALMFSVSLLLLFVAGARARALIGVLALAAPAAAFELWRKPYRRARLLSFLTPFENIKGAGYQLSQSILAVGSGGWVGKGFGASKLKLMYLPTPHTDFIFPVVCEELGLVGAALILGLFGTILVRGARIARSAPNLFGTLLAAGISFSIVLQAFFNVAMSIGLLPTKGIPLPFFSYGGSSLLSTMIGVGVLLNISRQARAEALP